MKKGLKLEKPPGKLLERVPALRVRVSGKSSPSRFSSVSTTSSDKKFVYYGIVLDLTYLAVYL